MLDNADGERHSDTSWPTVKRPAVGIERNTTVAAAVEEPDGDEVGQQALGDASRLEGP